MASVAEGSRNAGQAAGKVAAAALRLAGDLLAVSAAAAAAGRGVLGVMGHPGDLAGHARKLQMAAPLLRQAVSPLLTGRVDWEAEYAYTAGVQAFIYGFPYIYNAKIRHDWVTQARDPQVIPYAAVNHFWHASHPMDAAYRDGGCPNNDTLYSLAWLDLSEEPVILSHPEMGDRYFTFELMAFTSDNIDYIGQRTTGSAAGDFAITGPGWKGRLPAGVKKTQTATTPWVLVLGRTLTDGGADLADVQALQAQYLLTPRSLWGRSGTVPERRDVYAPAEPAADPLGPWKTLNEMLAENPPPAHHALLLSQFARIGIGPAWTSRLSQMMSSSP